MAGQTIINLGTGGADLNGQSGSTTGSDSNDPKWLDWTGTNYLYLPGAASNYMTVPDEAALDITGDIDIRARVALDDWTPAANMVLVAKFGSAGQKSYEFRVQPTTGYLVLTWTADGTTEINAISTVAPTVTDGATLWVRVTLDVNNGAGGCTANFYTSSDGTTWSALGAAVTIGATTSIFASTTALEVGTRGGASFPLAGSVYQAQVYSGIGGTKVLDVDTSVITTGSATSFTALTGQTVTINRATSGRKAVAVVCPVWLFGTDDFLDVVDNSLLDMGADQSFTVIAVLRQWATEAFAPYAFKGLSWTAANKYYAVMSSNGTSLISAQLADAVTEVSDTAAFTRGAVTVAAGVVDRSADTLTAYVNGVASGSPTSIPAIGSLDNAYGFRVGRLGTAASYADAEILAVAVCRRALSATELAAIYSYYSARWP